MIPKMIHYCWFGNNSLPELAEKCIASWKKYCPEYKLMLWNEDNFDINSVPFTKQVAQVKKWGFIVDYIRAYAVCNYGGIYLDTDVEIIKSFDDYFFKNTCFAGFEDKKKINPGSIFAGEKGCVIANELMDFYSVYDFIKPDGKLNLTPAPVILTNILLKYGLKQNDTYQELGVFTSYPTEYFCPFSYRTRKLTITNKTYSIHHYEASWLSDEKNTLAKSRKFIYNIFGDNIFAKIIIRIVNIFIRIKENGLCFTIKWYYNLITDKIRN